MIENKMIWVPKIEKMLNNYDYKLFMMEKMGNMLRS